MTNKKNSKRSLAQEGFCVHPEGYHSAEDARRMQLMARAMLDERRPLALSSPDAETLAHYARLLVRDLRQFPQAHVLPHLPSTTDLLLAHVNQLIADLPVEAVVDRQLAAQRPAQVLVVHDTPQLSSEALALLVRLLGDLPGANLRLVLVQGRDLAVSDSLQALGPQALHWSILPPGVTADEAARAERARQALRDALQAPRQDAVLGTAPQPSGARAGAPLPAAPSWVKRPAPALAAKTRADAPSHASARSPRPDRGATASTRAPQSATARRNGVMLTGGLILSAALATTLGLWLSTHQPAARPLSSAQSAVHAGAPAPSPAR